MFWVGPTRFIVQEDCYDTSDTRVLLDYFWDRHEDITSDKPILRGTRTQINDLINRRLMPMLIVGSGMGNLASKLHLLLHAIMLEVARNKQFCTPYSTHTPHKYPTYLAQQHQPKQTAQYTHTPCFTT
jgi:hypothetical protein